jgi:hypothetical protein
MNRQLSPAVRRSILGAAFLAATLVALLPDPAPVQASERLAVPIVLAQDVAAPATAPAIESPKDAARTARDAAREAAKEAKAAAREATRKAIEAEFDANDEEQSGRHKGFRLGVDGLDRQYDSFDQFVDHDPALAVMVFGLVFIVFLTPVLIIALLIWYKVRKTRMLNETMLKLAEKGIVPPAQALEALQTGRAAQVLESTPGATSLLTQAGALRSRAAWSDLRKGVLLGAVGFAWTIWSIFDDGAPNWLGLVLLFVGVGYVALAYFENRQTESFASTPASGPGDVNN